LEFSVNSRLKTPARMIFAPRKNHDTVSIKG